MKILSVLFLIFTSQLVVADSSLHLEQCLRNEIQLGSDKASHSLFNPKVVDQIEDYLKMENVQKLYEEKDLSVFSVNSPHGTSSLKSYLYNQEGNVAAFVINVEEKWTKLNCIYTKSNKLKFLDWLYVGQKAEVVIGKLSIEHSVDAVYIERGETVVEIYFESGVVSLLRYRAYFD